MVSSFSRRLTLIVVAWQVLCEVLAGVDGDVIASLLRDALEAYAAGEEGHSSDGGEDSGGKTGQMLRGGSNFCSIGALILYPLFAPETAVALIAWFV